MDHLRELKYLEACIKEALRMRPPVHEWFRAHPTGQYLTIKNEKFFVEPSSSIFTVTYFIQMDPAHFHDPKTFNPDRFLQDNKRHPFSFIPFSAGARNCIGQKFAMTELKVVLSMLLRTFSFTPQQVVLSKFIKLKSSQDTYNQTVASDFVSSPWPNLLFHVSNWNMSIYWTHLFK